jgi:predicted nucleic acid-binding Zn ribbon protein
VSGEGEVNDGLAGPMGATTGPELARAVLDAARARRPTRVPWRRGPDAEGQKRRPVGYSGPGPDPRDPVPVGAVLATLVKARGWQRPSAEARIFGTWEAIVGVDLASHCRPVKLEDGELTVEAESTAWATQLRLLTGRLLGRIAGEIGRDVVTRLNIHGPVAPSWAKGPRRIRGRGPRDTYG